ncbi:hypothetical protein Tco_1316231, partial [Tanacetum coccineum]
MWGGKYIKLLSFKDLGLFLKIQKIAKYEKNAKEYQDLFDTLLCRVEISQEHDVSLYLGGLPTELEMSVRMFKPRTLVDAYYLINLQEATLEAVKRNNKLVMSNEIGRIGTGGSYGGGNKPPMLALLAPNNTFRAKPNTPANAPMRKQLTQKEYQKKREQNLCFYCDQKYTPGHKCSGQLFSLMVLADGDEERFEWEEQEDLIGVEEMPQISLNALNCAIGKLGCKLKPTCPLAVTVAGGRHLRSV